MSLPYTRLGRHLNQNFRQYLPQNPSNCLANVFRVSSLVVQCNSYSSLNARRLARILQFYKKLYNQKSVYGLLQKLSTNFPSITKSFRNFKKFFVKSGTLLSASIFSFKSHGIADEDMIEVASSCVEKQADTVSDEENLHNFYAKSTKLLNAKNSLLRHEDLEHWELVSEKENFSIWRRKRLFSTSSQDDEQSTSNSGALYEYKCAGRYTDVPAYGFLIAQMDLEYRKKWDHLVVCLDVLECDSATGSEVIRWVTHFPYPMCPREYVYVRRACLDPVAKCIILTSKNVVNHPKCPRQDQKYVRVEEYFSSMIIKPHDDFSKNGFDYVLTYYDDPKAPFPSLAYNWMIKTDLRLEMSKKIDAASKSKEDEELSELLDNSLLDFGKSNLAPPENEADQNVDVDGARQAAENFQKMLQQLADIQKVFVDEMSNGNARPESAKSVPPPTFLESSDDENAGKSEDLEAAQNFLKNMQFLAEKAQKVQQASSEQELKQAMKDLNDDSTYESEFMPFMHGLMGSLLSKEMLYPPMKEMCEKFPKWINENRSKVDLKTMDNYETQLKLMTEICYEYEQENIEDTDKIRADRMDRLMNCMQKIQACGYPPEDLVGALPPGWSLDSKSGLPKAVDMSKAAEACSIM